jgi:hypothetical protein
MNDAARSSAPTTRIPPATYTFCEAIVRAGAFCGSKPVKTASARTLEEGQSLVVAMSKAEPETIFGLSEKTRKGSFVIAWFKNGEAV